MNRLLLRLLFIVLVIPSLSHAYSFPKGCEAMGHQFSDGKLLLNPAGEQTLYLMRSFSRDHIELKRYQSQQSFMSPTMSAKLLPKRWAAFASDVKDMQFRCYNVSKKDEQIINCANVLQVCQYPRAKFATSNKGNYWVSVNKSLRNSMRDAINKGILLRW